MKNELSSLPGYRLHEYMVVLQPHPDLAKKIIAVKNAFSEKYDAPTALWGKPYIPLLRFTQLQLMEERIFNRLKIIAMAIPAFKVELQGFGHYPSHTIFVQVESKIALQMVSKHLKTAKAILRTKEHKPHYLENFQITIANKLLPWQHEKAWTDLSHKHFTGRFVANEMILFRKTDEVSYFKPIKSFEFLNMPVLTTQGALF